MLLWLISWCKPVICNMLEIQNHIRRNKNKTAANFCPWNLTYKKCCDDFKVCKENNWMCMCLHLCISGCIHLYKGNFQGNLPWCSTNRILISIDPEGMLWAGSNQSHFCLWLIRTDYKYNSLHAELLPAGQMLFLEALGKNFTVPVVNFWADTQPLLGLRLRDVGSGPDPSGAFVCCTHNFQGTDAASALLWPLLTVWFPQQI